MKKLQLLKEPLRWLVSFVRDVLAEVVADRVSQQVIPSAMQALPLILVTFYNVSATAVLILVLASLVLGGWMILKECWGRLTKKHLREETMAQIRTLPATRFSPLTRAVVVISVITIFALVLESWLLANGRLTWIQSQEDVKSLILTTLMPFLFVWLIVVCRHTLQMYREIRVLWGTATAKIKVGLSATITLTLVAWTVVSAGEFAGWDHLLWFNAV